MTADPREVVECFVIHHEGCADESGPAPCPIEYGDVEVNVAALTGEADAGYLRDQFWTGGTVERYVMEPRAAHDEREALVERLTKERDAARESAKRLNRRCQEAESAAVVAANEAAASVAAPVERVNREFMDNPGPPYRPDPVRLMFARTFSEAYDAAHDLPEDERTAQGIDLACAGWEAVANLHRAALGAAHDAR
jgi:hypothetical protein